jgi:membrane protease YdiL (CAAX protease family)
MDYLLADHLLIGFLLLVLPVDGALQLRRLKAAVDRGESGARLRVYRQTILREALLGAAVVVLWMMAGRAADGLGLTFAGPSGAAWWVGWTLALAASAFMAAQMVAARRSPDALEGVAEKVRDLAVFLPHTSRELRTFWMLSLAAGVFEELVFRGYAMAYLMPVAGPVGALVGSAILFGLAHRYQGWSGVAKTGAVGLVLGGLYLATGALWAPMLLHAVVDVSSGTVAQQALAAEGDPSPDTAPAGA